MSVTTSDEVMTVYCNYGLYNGDGKTEAVVSEDIDLLVAETDEQYARAMAQRGDVNGDHSITVTDVAVIAAHVKNIRPIDKYSTNAADVNNDGDINVTDIVSAAAHVKSIRPITAER